MRTVAGEYVVGAVYSCFHLGDAWSKPGRPAVIVVATEVDSDGYVTVAYGRGERHPSADHVEVRMGSDAGKAMGLRKDTYFWPDDVREVHVKFLNHQIGTTDPWTLMELEDIEYRARKKGCLQRVPVEALEASRRTPRTVSQLPESDALQGLPGGRAADGRVSHRKP